MYCGQCGAPIPEGLVLCNKCDRENNVIASPTHSPTNISVEYKHSPPNIELLSKVAIGSCALSILASSFCAYQSNLLATALANSLEFPAIQLLCSTLDNALIWSAVLELITQILFLVWVYKSYKMLQYFYPVSDIKFTPAWAVGWFFIPIANVFKPYQVIKELFKKSQPIDSSKGFSNRTTFTLVWWIIFLISKLSGRIPNDLENLISSQQLDLFINSLQSDVEVNVYSEIIVIVNVALILFIIYKISNMLAERKASVNAQENWS